MYSEKVMDHFMNPRNVGEIENASGVGTVGNAKCGDIMRMYLDIDDNGIIQDVKFKTFGCGAAVATSSMATELVKGKTIQQALEVTNKAVMEALDGLPPVKVHCSLLAEEAIHAALWDYAEKNGIKITEADGKIAEKTVVVDPTKNNGNVVFGTVEFDIEVTTPGDGMISITAPNTNKGPGIDYFIISPKSVKLEKFAITATAGEGGTITAESLTEGKVDVTEGESATFTITPNSGYEIADVKVDGKSILKEEFDLSQIGILIENPGFYPHLTGFENLEMLYRLNNEKNDQHIYDILKSVGLDYAGDKKYKEYSLGMKQRLRIAQAIMENQKIIILDEPTNGIDRSGLKDVHEIIKEEKNKGKIILLASHDLDDSKLLCDKIYFIENGRVKDFLTEISND